MDQKLAVYWKMVKDRSSLLNKRASDQLILDSSLLNEICIAATGSDGRLEKGPLSPLELIIFSRNSEYANQVSTIINSLNFDQFTIIDHASTERKIVGGTSPLSYAMNDEKKVFPSRIFDSVVLAGDPKILLDAKKELVLELANINRIFEYVQGKKKSARRVMESGQQEWKGQNIVHYDLTNGIAFLNNQNSGDIESKSRSFKMGPLRYVQYSIEQHLLGKIRGFVANGKTEMAVGLLTDLPTPTVEKLKFLSENKLLNLKGSVLSEAIECYLAFLELYHISENLCQNNQTEFKFDISEVTKRIGDLKTIFGSGKL